MFSFDAMVVRRALPMALLALVVFVVASEAGIAKRDVLDDLKDEIPQGSVCLTDDQCSFLEYCNRDNVLNMHCSLQIWVIAVIAAAALAVLLSLGFTCLCCPCCCLYSMCRKG